MFSEEDGMNILLAGGAGFIGTWVARIATAMGHTVTVVDDLSGAAEFNVKWLDSHKVPRVCASTVRDALLFYKELANAPH